MSTKLGETEQSVRALIALCDPSQPWQIRLHGLNALTFIGDAAKPTLDAAKLAAGDQRGYLQSAGKYLALKLTGQYAPSVPIFDWEALQARSKAGNGPE